MKFISIIPFLLFAFETVHAAEADKPVTYIGEKDCLVSNPNPVADERITWSGACKNGFAEGAGVLQFYRQDKETSRYEGELHAGIRQGKAVLSRPNGSKYVGTYVNDELTGEVEFTSAKGDFYKGGWKNGRQEGSGKFKSVDGWVYEGEFKEGKRDGKGSTTLANGNRYEGSFSAGFFDGQGTMQFANGGRYEGSWKAGKYDGKGTLTTPDGKSFTGEFRQGEKVDPAFAVAQSNKSEKGRLQICRVSDAPESQKDIEIPADGKYVIAPSKGGLQEPVTITQTDFSSSFNSTAQGQYNATLRDQFKLENRAGKLLVHFDGKSAACIYLNAEAPALAGSDVTVSGSYAAPDWMPGAKGSNADGVSYRYFNAIDQTYYVASEVGKFLSFGAHKMQTGTYLNHDRILKEAVKNEKVLALVPDAFKWNLAHYNQYDTNLIDLAKFDIKAQDINVQSSADVSALVAKFVNAVHPQPHARLILALPVKGEVQLKFSNTALIGNKMEGLGFYRDLNLHIIYDSDHDDYVPIDAFFNFQAAVIDVDTAKLVTAKTFTDGRIFFRPPLPEPDLIDTISDMSKYFALQGIVNVGVGTVMSEMFVVK